MLKSKIIPFGILLFLNLWQNILKVKLKGVELNILSGFVYRYL